MRRLTPLQTEPTLRAAYCPSRSPCWAAVHHLMKSPTGRPYRMGTGRTRSADARPGVSHHASDSLFLRIRTARLSNVWRMSCAPPAYREAPRSSARQLDALVRSVPFKFIWTNEPAPMLDAQHLDAGADVIEDPVCAIDDLSNLLSLKLRNHPLSGNAASRSTTLNSSTVQHTAASRSSAAIRSAISSTRSSANSVQSTLMFRAS